MQHLKLKSIINPAAPLDLRIAPELLSDTIRHVCGLVPESAERYELRNDALRSIARVRDLPEADVLALMGYVAATNGSLRVKREAALKNDILNLLVDQNPVPEGLADLLIGMVAAGNHPPVILDYCIQHLGALYGDGNDAATLMNMAGYIDRNPVKAKVVRWPDKYAWCSFSAACKGDRRCIDGYRFIYSVFAPLSWERIREMHEKSIHLVLNMSDQVPHLLEKGSDKVACDVLKQLADGPKRPNELRAAVGIASANYFTARYLTPLAEAGYIAVEGGEKNRYAPDKRYKLLRKGKAVSDA